MNTARILVVDDELVVCRSVKKVLEKKGHRVEMTQQGKDALLMIGRTEFDLLIVDLKMPEIDGIGILKKVKEIQPEATVLMITGYPTVETAVEAMKSGAFDYIVKPFSPDELSITVERALETRRLKEENLLLKKRLRGVKFPGIIGDSKKMQEVFASIEKVAPTSATVLISGESGSGKELVARAIHNLSKRAEKRFVAVDCGAFSSELLKSELFGHMKGSFTGAVSTKKGLLEIADGGTIFFDEIANMDMDVQGKILRVLQEREFVPLGGTEPRKVNVRLISATNRDPKKIVDEGKFREDLFYRIYVVPIHVPPLRERKEDIPSLAYYFLQKFTPGDEESYDISPGAMEKLIDYDWPGNVRQLENIIQRAIIMAGETKIEPKHLFIAPKAGGSPHPHYIPKTNEELKKMKKVYRQEAVEWLERNFVICALESNDWNITRAAASADMQRTNFHTLINKYHLKEN